MAITFSKSEFQAQTDWSFTRVGNFKTLTKGMKLAFTKKNLSGKNRLTVQIFPKKHAALADAIEADEVYKVSCTAPLSETIREGIKKGVSLENAMKFLLSLDVQESNENPDIKLIFAPQGDGNPLEVFESDRMKAEVPEDFAAF